MKKTIFLFASLLGAVACMAQDTISKKAYETLTPRQKFDYDMIHGEVFSQNCSALPLGPDRKKIAAQLPDLSFFMRDHTWSDRQWAFFRANRESVIRWMKEDIRRTKVVGLQYASMIVGIDAVGMIPFLLSSDYSDEPYVLTAFMLLMIRNKYDPFLTTSLCKLLYKGPESSYRSFVEATPDRERQIRILAGQFYDDRRRMPHTPEFSYQEYRDYFSMPPFDREKVDKAMKQAQEEIKKRDSVEFVRASAQLTATVLAGLSLREQYTYHIIHPENYLQTCGRIMTGGYSEKKIAARLPFYQIEYHWSKEQAKFFRENKDSVLAWISADIRRTGRAGLNYKHAIVECGDKRIVPLLIATYQREKMDHDLLTVLLLLMEKAKYPPFLQSRLYIPLYGPDASWHEEIAYNKANEAAILALAKGYYAGGSHGQ